MTEQTREAMSKGPQDLEAKLRTVVVPYSFTVDIDVWCAECGKRTPMSQGELCITCRKADEGPPFRVGMSEDERRSRVHVTFRASGSWNVSREDFRGTDDEWAELIRALAAGRNATKEQQKLLDEAWETFSQDWESHVWDPEGDLTLSRPRVVHSVA